MIAIRKQHPALALGTFHDLGGSNDSVLAFVRVHEEQTVLCVHNLSAHAQAAPLDLGTFAGQKMTELLGRQEFPAVNVVTLPGYGSYLLEITD